MNSSETLSSVLPQGLTPNPRASPLTPLQGARGIFRDEGNYKGRWELKGTGSRWDHSFGEDKQIMGTEIGVSVPIVVLFNKKDSYFFAGAAGAFSAAGASVVAAASFAGAASALASVFAPSAAGAASCWLAPNP